MVLGRQHQALEPGGGHRRAAGFTFLGAHIEELFLPAEEAGEAGGEAKRAKVVE